MLKIRLKRKKLNILNLKKELLESNIPLNQKYSARLIARPVEDSRLPSRIKIGLDLGAKSEFMPCNLCTNFQPFNPSLESKPQSFKWAPLLTDQSNCCFWLMNSSPKKNYNSTATIELTFFREKDTATLKRTLTIPPHGFVCLEPLEDPELKSFFEGSIGWCTLTSTNAYLTSYYFTENESGVVGGDHGF